MKALLVPTPGQPLTLTTLPTPTPTPGSCILRILAVEASPLTPRLIQGLPGYTFPPNFIPGAHAIGRVVATGPDATTLLPGQLVMLEGFIRPRDDPNEEQILFGIMGGFTEKSQKFMEENWAWGCMAEYVRAPLENVYPLDEARLCGSLEKGGLGYAVEDLLRLPTQLVAFGGLRAIDVEAGERVIIAPATGGFSGAAVQVAVAMGAQVVAVGRDIGKLERVKGMFFPGRVQAVQVTGDVEKDTAALKQFGPVDAFLDLSPPTAGQSTHLRSCFAALRKYGRACIMSAIEQDVALPYPLLMLNSLTVRGQFMYERADARLIIKMAEGGMLKLGKEGGNEIVGRFKLEEADEAFAVAAANHEIGRYVVLTP
jgi:NADPH:quinone reductase-like Zn-dependent oxidoreductase